MTEQPAPGWYADPTRRFDHRYWDGTTWTEHVSRNGQATTDPLDGGGAEPGTGQDTAADTGAPAAGTPGWETGTGQPWHTGSGQTWETGGGAPSWQTQARTTGRTNTKAVVSLVLSIIWFGGLASVAAVVLGVMAKREIGERPGEVGSGVATAGIIIGAIGILGGLLILIAIISYMSFGAVELVLAGAG